VAKLVILVIVLTSVLPMVGGILVALFKSGVIRVQGGRLRLSKTTNWKRHQGPGRAAGRFLASADQKLWLKLEPYQQCLDRHVERVHTSKRYYLSRVDHKTGPSCKRRYYYGPHSLYDPDRCAKGVRDANGKKPSLAKLENAADSFVRELRALQPIVRKLRRYYQQKDYLDDQCAYGQKAHKTLMAHFAAFEKAATEMRSVIAPKRRKLLVAMLDATKKQPELALRAQFITVLVEAEKLVETFHQHAGFQHQRHYAKGKVSRAHKSRRRPRAPRRYRLSSRKAAELARIKRSGGLHGGQSEGATPKQKAADKNHLEALGQAVKRFAAAVDKLERLADGPHRAQAKKVFWFSAFRRSANNMLETAKTIWRKERSHSRRRRHRRKSIDSAYGNLKRAARSTRFDWP
jgi:hypothetical protein